MDCDLKSSPDLNPCPHLSFIIDKAFAPKFFPFLQRGVTIRGDVGCSVKTFLSEEIGVGPDVLEKIQSIFLDGGPVDDLDSAIIKGGAVLALSAAMPGLVGATMRRGGAYSSFRSSITHHETGAQCVPGEGFVTVKLFNLLIPEMGPDLLRRGGYVRSSDMTELLSDQAEDFWEGCKQILLNDKPVEAGAKEVNKRISHSEEIFFSVVAAGDRWEKG